MKIYWIIVAILMGCSSSEKLDHRPYEIFLAPSYSYQKILKNSALTKPQKNQTFKDEIEAMEEMWEKQNLEKRKKFEKFLKQSKEKFAKQQIQQRNKFVKARPSREMLGAFLAQQAQDQRDFYKKSIADKDFFDRNENHLNDKFSQYIQRIQKGFSKALNTL